ncbi:MAG: nucleotidyltransferase domain-containing protein [Oscillospiraceae bacterium]|nr:nucleotidyltransferase domain-containing protein [Oscillospiraceae bacterium]
MNPEITIIIDLILSVIAVEKIILFGSHAYGTPNDDSDYDIYMVIPDDGIRPIDAIGKAHLSMRGTGVKPVDFLAGTVEMFERRSKQSTLERKIAREGVVLYERRQQSL